MALRRPDSRFMEGIRADVALVVVPLPKMHRALGSIPRTTDEKSNLWEEINGNINVTQCMNVCWRGPCLCSQRIKEHMSTIQKQNA